MTTAVAPVEVKRVPLGVYVSRERDTAIAFRQAKDGIWFLSIRTGKVIAEHLSDERFLKEFPLVLPGYPVRKAARTYKNSLLNIEDTAARVLEIILRD